MTAVNLESVRGEVETLRHVKRQKQILKDLEAKARAVVEEKMGGQDVGELDGLMAIKISRYKSRKLQQKKLADAHPEIVAEFTELTPVTRMDIVEPDPS